MLHIYKDEVYKEAPPFQRTINVNNHKIFLKHCFSVTKLFYALSNLATES